MNTPFEISINEWKRIMQVPEVREAWGLGDDTTPEDFASLVYGARFEFVSGSPGYIGDIYILQGDHLTGDLPFVLIKQNGQLTLAN